MKWKVDLPPGSKSFVQYVLHAALASYGIMIVGGVVSYLVGLPFGSARYVDYFFIGPTFLFPILAGLIFGVVFGPRLPKVPSRTIYLFPLALMIWEVATWTMEPGMTLQGLVDTFVGKHCGSSECMGEVLVTAPFISALAYSVGAELGRLRRSLSQESA